MSNSHHHHHHHSHPPHVEAHFSASEIVRDAVLGMADGLTVPFALAAGLSGAVAKTHIIVTAGIAEIAAGSIAMGLGGYLAAKTEAEHFHKEREREVQETIELPEKEAEEVADIFRSYGLDEKSTQLVVKSIRSDQKRWVDFMMKFELGIDPPTPGRALQSAVTIGSSYVVGGLIPLLPYVFIANSQQALYVSSAITALALFVFGWIKGRFSLARPFRSASQTLIVGGVAAATAYFIARLVS